MTKQEFIEQFFKDASKNMDGLEILKLRMDDMLDKIDCQRCEKPWIIHDCVNGV